jgi:hypothetical protein
MSHLPLPPPAPHNLNSLSTCPHHKSTIVPTNKPVLIRHCHHIKSHSPHYAHTGCCVFYGLTSMATHSSWKHRMASLPRVSPKRSFLLWSHDIFTISILLPFPEGHIVGTLQYIMFSVAWEFISSSPRTSRCTMIYAFIHLLRKSCWPPNFLAIMNKAAINNHNQAFVWILGFQLIYVKKQGARLQDCMLSIWLISSKAKITINFFMK